MHHSKSATLELCQLIAKKQTNISLIQEPWVHNTQVLGFGACGGNVFVGSSVVNPRACIFVSGNINAQLISEISSRDCVAVQTTLKTKKHTLDIVVASVYLPFDAPKPLQFKELMTILTFCQAKRLNLVIGCDANAHNPLWGSSDTNVRGEALAEFLSQWNLEILNKGVSPTFCNGRRNEVIDISLANMSLSPLIQEWHVSDLILTSDHRCIYFEVENDCSTVTTFRNRRNTNWELFCEYVSCNYSDSISPMMSVDEVSIKIETVQNVITSAFETACPLSIVNRKRNSSWWSSSLQKLRRDVRRKLNKFRRSKLLADEESYKSSQRLYKYELRRSYRLAWQEYCKGIESVSDSSRLLKTLTKNKKCQLGFLKLPSGEFTSSKKETAEFMLKVHFPGSAKPSSQLSNVLQNNPTASDWQLAQQIIDDDRLKWAIFATKPFKSEGPDGIFPALIQKSFHLLKGTLKNIFQACIVLGFIPDVWRRVNVVFLPKPGKNDYSDPKSFRPICLSSFFIKTLERLIDRYIREKHLTDIALCPEQHAYQNGKSVDTALHQLVTKVERALETKSVALAAFLDIEGAFDNATFASIADALRRHGVNNTIIQWIISMLHSRIVRFALDDTVSEVVVSKGCPQGGVLSPLLWTLVVDSLLVLLNNRGFYAQGYADDVTIIVVGKDVGILSELMQRALTYTQQWCEKHELVVNSNKSDIIAFSRKRNALDFNTPNIFNRSLNRVIEVKYLGILLDVKLSWKPHILYKVKKAKLAFWQCRRAIGGNWGLSPRVVFWIYTAIIRPTITFGCHVWWHKTEIGVYDSLMSQIQRLACMSISSAMGTTPTRALEAFFGLPPLSLFVRSVAIRTAYRLKCSGQWNTMGVQIGHRRIVRLMESISPIFEMPYDSLLPTYIFSLPFTIGFPSREDWTQPRGDGSLENEFSWYTDGSLMCSGSGAGVFSNQCNTNISVALGKHASVFQSEVFAIIECTKVIHSMNLCNQNIKIYTDSQAAIRAVSAPLVNSKLVLECKQRLSTIGQNNRVCLEWVPGHSRIVGNEQADSLARCGASGPFIGPEPAVGISRSLAFETIASYFKCENWRSWNSLRTCRQARCFFNIKSVNSIKFLIGLKREALRLMVGVLSGHARLNKHLYQIHVAPNPLCGECETGEDEDSEHFLCRCPRYMHLRFRLFGDYFIEPSAVISLPLSKVYSFVSDSGRFLN